MKIGTIQATHVAATDIRSRAIALQHLIDKRLRNKVDGKKMWNRDVQMNIAKIEEALELIKTTMNTLQEEDLKSDPIERSDYSFSRKFLTS